MKRIKFFVAFLFALLLLIISASKSFAQYDIAIGFRAGPTKAIVYKQFFAPRVAVDGWLGFNNGPLLKGFYIFSSNNHDIRIEIANVAFFTGVGAYAWYYKNSNPQTDIKANSVLLVGIDVIAGVEYKLPRVPFVVSADINPGFIVVNHKKSAHDFDLDFGVAVRYIF